VNPRVPTFLRSVTWLECGVVASAATLLFLFPRRGGQEVWAWVTPPFNARYVGTIYLGALVPLLALAARGRWFPGRLVLWMILVFTTAIMVVMLASPGRFEWERPATWVFWALYLFLPVNSVVYLWRLRGLPAGERRGARPALVALGLLLGLYGLALLVAPERATEFWPWSVDAFHARIYAATFLTPAVGAWLIHDRGGGAEDRTLGATLVVFAVAAVLGVLVTDASVPAAARVDYGDAGTWAFFALNVGPGLAGAVLLARPRTP